MFLSNPLLWRKQNILHIAGRGCPVIPGLSGFFLIFKENLMKRIAVIVLLFLAFSPSSLYSQTMLHIKKGEFKIGKEGFDKAWQHLQQGDIWFRKGIGSYPLALREYLEANNYNPGQPELNYKIGICYLFTDHKDKALEYLTKAYKLGKELTPDIYYFLGLASQYNYKFDDALQNYRYFMNHGEKKVLKILGEQVRKHIEECEYAKEIMKDTVRVRIEDLGNELNSEYDDYKTVLNPAGDHLYFTSRRPESDKQLPNRYDNKFEEDIYQSVQENGVWSEAYRMKKPVNSKYNDAAVAVSPDDRKLFIYRGNKRNGSILVSKNKKGKWKKPCSALPHINTKGQETSLFFLPDSNTVYFVSDNKKMNHGGKDIFKIQRLENGKWGKPEPLDTTINTPYDEESPYVTPDGKTLYFSSQGHNSIGGFDVFRSVKDSAGHWSAPENLGYPVNTPDDDLFYTPSPVDSSVAYISGVREETVGLKDMYRITWLPPLPVDTVKVDTVPKDTVPEVKPRPVTPPAPVIVPVPVPEVKPWIIEGKVLDSRDSLPVMASIDIIDLGKNEIIGKTISGKEDGAFRITAKNRKSIGVELNAPGYMFFLDVIPAPENDTVTRTTYDFYLKKIEAGAKVVLQNIFFDFAKATLKPESFPSLDRVVKFMQDNPDIKVEIAGHTDNIGSDAVNLKLSRARAAAVVDYLVSKEINPSRLVAKGYGESQPVAPNDTDEGRAQNRRVEFKILKL